MRMPAAFQRRTMRLGRERTDAATASAALPSMSFHRSSMIDALVTDLTGRLPARRALGDLVTHGHAEMTGADSWRVAPPVLAGLPREAGSSAVLCGARTPALLESLGRA